MAFSGTGKIWMNGKLVEWKDATIHIASHVVHYGSGVFEGARCYDTLGGPACFRLDAHIRRLFDSARIYRMDVPYEQQAISDAILDLIQVNKFRACYIRPLIYRGYENLGVNPFGSPVEVAIAAFPWGKYLGEDALTKGCAVKVSSWQRFAPNTLPAMAKASANYMNSQLMKMEAIKDGYAEGIALDAEGFLSEGSGENLFLVSKGTLITPPLVSSVLPGITRDSILTLARRQGLKVHETRLLRESLYIADEVFLTGTAAEITPVRSVDRIVVGKGARGPVTEALQKAFFDVIECRVPDEFGWLTFVREKAAAGAASGRATTATK
jgi:branched-chain amino acid aminotransferase